MAEYNRSDKQSEAYIDPAARTGIKRFMATQDAEQLAGFIRDCLRAVDRKAAVMIFNKHVLGIPLPSSSDRGRIGSMLRDTLRAGRPDAFECLQNLTSYQLETALGDDQYEVYEEAVDGLNEAAKDGGARKITAAAKKVVAAMRVAMDDESIKRYVRVHALPETLDALLKAAATKPKASAAKAASGDTEASAATTSDKPGKALPGGKRSTSSRAAARMKEPKAPGRGATRGAAKATPAKRKTVRRSGGG